MLQWRIGISMRERKKNEDIRISPEDYVVRLGEHVLNDADQGDEYSVEDIIIHEEFLPPVVYNDIALLKLASVIQFKNSVSPLCLPIGQEIAREVVPNTEVVITGWGTLSFAGENSPNLMEVYIPITSNAECDESYRTINNRRKYPNGITSTIICAGLKEGGKDACQGDSGGPLAWHDTSSNTYKLVGIVSGGFQCARANFPGLYTRVTEYLSWIANNI
ncbi:Clotting factor B [Nymphon striatum]|nr:Clotting factor B [Nymphon striatum]